MSQIVTDGTPSPSPLKRTWLGLTWLHPNSSPTWTTISSNAGDYDPTGLPYPHPDRETPFPHFGRLFSRKWTTVPGSVPRQRYPLTHSSLPNVVGPRSPVGPNSPYPLRPSVPFFEPEVRWPYLSGTFDDSSSPYPIRISSSVLIMTSRNLESRTLNPFRYPRGLVRPRKHVNPLVSGPHPLAGGPVVFVPTR